VSAVSVERLRVSGDDRLDRRPEAALALFACETTPAWVVSMPEVAAVCALGGSHRAISSCLVGAKVAVISSPRAEIGAWFARGLHRRAVIRADGRGLLRRLGPRWRDLRRLGADRLQAIHRGAQVAGLAFDFNLRGRAFQDRAYDELRCQRGLLRFDWRHVDGIGVGHKRVLSECVIN